MKVSLLRTAKVSMTLCISVDCRAASELVNVAMTSDYLMEDHAVVVDHGIP